MATRLKGTLFVTILFLTCTVAQQRSFAKVTAVSNRERTSRVETRRKTLTQKAQQKRSLSKRKMFKQFMTMPINLVTINIHQIDIHETVKSENQFSKREFGNESPPVRLATLQNELITSQPSEVLKKRFAQLSICTLTQIRRELSFWIHKNRTLPPLFWLEWPAYGLLRVGNLDNDLACVLSNGVQCSAAWFRIYALLQKGPVQNDRSFRHVFPLCFHYGTNSELICPKLWVVNFEL